MVIQKSLKIINKVISIDFLIEIYLIVCGIYLYIIKSIYLCYFRLTGRNKSLLGFKVFIIAIAITIQIYSSLLNPHIYATLDKLTEMKA